MSATAMDWFDEGYEAGEEEAQEQIEDGDYTGVLPSDLIDPNGGLFGIPAPDEDEIEDEDTEVPSIPDGGSESDTQGTGEIDNTTLLLVGFALAVAVLIGVRRWADS